MRSSQVLLTLALGTAINAAPNKNGVEFLYPTAGLTLNFMDTINVTYTSPFPKPLLYTFCTNKTNTKDLIQKEVFDANPYNSSHLVTLNYVDVAECYWNLRPNTSTGYGGNSEKIKLLTEGRSQTTLGLSPTSVPTSSPSASSTPVEGGQSSSSGGMSTGAKAGIGAGIGIVALLAIVGLVFWLMRRRKSRAGGGEKNIHEVPGMSANAPGYGSPQQQNKVFYGNEEQKLSEEAGHGQSQVNELSATREQPVYEMSGDGRAVEAPTSVKR